MPGLRMVILPEPLIETIERLESPVLIAVSGFGGSGKSSFASALGHKISSPVIGIDSFLIDRTLPWYARWEIMDFRRLQREVLQPFLEGKAIRYGHFDWSKNAVCETRELLLAKRLIVEGVGLFRPELLNYFSFLIWVDCPLHESIRRGKKRDREEYSNSQDQLWDGIWKENDEECYRMYRPKQIADFIFDNSDPEIQ